ncbi:hypothetical protein Tco_0623126 [Tanacetum coccineum]
MWGDMAREFDKGLVETMEGPVIIVVSSYLQLSASPATHYYLNSEIPETKRSMAKVSAREAYVLMKLLQKVDDFLAALIADAIIGHGFFGIGFG